jgi:hypothetical protein
MKRAYRFFTILATLTLLLACHTESTPSIPIIIDELQLCSYDAQTIEIDYNISSSQQIALNATADKEWVEIIDNSTPRKVIVGVSQNDGATREATITFTANGYAPLKVRLIQYSAPPTTATHTLMFYFFGTSLNGYFKTNLEDAQKAIATGILGDKNRVVFFRHRSKSEAYIGELCFDTTSKTCTERIIEDGIIIEDGQLTPKAISRYINKMAAAAPAERYGIILAGHGQGWIPREALNGGNDINIFSYGNPIWQPAAGAEVTRAFGENIVQVDTAEIAEGIEGADIELDYILFDACFMSNIEAIYDLRNAANYIIASPCEIMGNGFPYERTLPYLFENEGSTTNYIKAAESYHKYYRDDYLPLSRCGSIAVYECSEVEALAEATAEVVKSATDNYDKSALQTYEGQNPHYFYDFGEWVNAIATDDNALDIFNVQLEKTIIAKYTLDTFYSAYGTFGTYDIDIEAYSGVTTLAPSEVFTDYWKQSNWYKAVWK